MVFESNCHLSSTHDGGFTLSLFDSERLARKLYTNFYIVFGSIRTGLNPVFGSVADALSIRLLMYFTINILKGHEVVLLAFLLV